MTFAAIRRFVFDACAPWRDGLGSDDRAAAGAVVDNDAPAVRLPELFGDHAGGDVGAAAGRVSHDDAYRLGRIILRARCD